MKSSFTRIVLALSGAFFSTLIYAQEPINLDVAKQTVMKYHDSGQYDQDVIDVMTKATDYLADHLPQIGDHKQAVVLDIDETALSNYTMLTTLRFGGTLEEIHELELLGQDAVIQPTLKFYQFAKSHDLAVFFITGRPESERDATVRNLQTAGYKNWDGIFFKPAGFHANSASVYKTRIREQLTAQGYHIVENIGDQLSDLAGDDTGKNFKLPNPFYFIP